MTEETWTAKHDEAVLLVAEDALTDVEIAEQVGISKRTLEAWKKLPLFQERLDAAISEIRAALMKHGIARLDRRIARLNKTWLGLQQVIKEREGDIPGHVPGAGTGLVVGEQKTVGSGFDACVITEYRADTGILAEMRALEMQAAKELGQWTEKRDVTSGGKALPPGPDLRNLSAERLAQLEEILLEAEHGGAADPAPG